MTKYGSFSIDELRETAGQGETVSLPSHGKNRAQTKATVGQVGGYKRQQDHRSRAETEELIKSAIADAGRALTFNMIAEALNRSTSPHLRTIIVAMVERGELTEAVDVPNNPKMVRYWYGLP